MQLLTTRTSIPRAEQAAARPATIPAELIEADPGVSAELREAATRPLTFITDADRQLLQQYGLRVHLVDADAVGHAGGQIQIGGTQVERLADGTWMPRSIRVAARPLDGTPVWRVVPHEVGHAVSALRRQDRSEAAAEAYAADVLRRMDSPTPSAARHSDAREGQAATRHGSGATGVVAFLGIAAATAGLAFLLL